MRRLGFFTRIRRILPKKRQAHGSVKLQRVAGQVFSKTSGNGVGKSQAKDKSVLVRGSAEAVAVIKSQAPVKMRYKVRLRGAAYYPSSTLLLHPVRYGKGGRLNCNYIRVQFVSQQAAEPAKRLHLWALSWRQKHALLKRQKKTA